MIWCFIDLYCYVSEDGECFWVLEVVIFDKAFVQKCVSMPF